MSNKKGLTDLTPEIIAKIPQYIKDGIRGVFDGELYRNFDIDKAKEAVAWNYKQSNFEVPEVIVVENPKEIFETYKILLKKAGYTKEKFDKLLADFNVSDMYLYTLNVYSQSYYQWYKFIKNEFNLPLTIEKEFEECFKLQQESGIYCALFLDKICIVSKYPKKIYRNSDNNLHNLNGQAVEWGFTSEKSKFNCYYVNGRNIPEELYLKALNGEITKKDWLSETNEDIKSAWYEILGPDKVMEILEAKEIDSQTIVHDNGELENHILYKTKFILSEIGEHLAWVKFICPSTGSNYLISVNPKWNTCKEAVLDTCPFFGDEIKTPDQYYFTVRG